MFKEVDKCDREIFKSNGSYLFNNDAHLNVNHYSHDVRIHAFRVETRVCETKLSLHLSTTDSFS